MFRGTGRRAGVSAAVAAIAVLALPSAASGKAVGATQPRLSLERNCEIFIPVAGTIDTRLTGFPPFTPFDWTIETPDGAVVGPVRFTTDANGNWASGGYIGSYTPGTFTVTIEWSGGTLTQSLYVDCSKPASKKDCKKGGWRDFDFKNQGHCIRSVKKGPKA